MANTYKATARTIRKGMIGTVASQKIVFDIIGDDGLYGTLATREDAEIVAFGLNNNFLQSQFGGFAENVVAEIIKAMRGEVAADWAIVTPLSAEEAAREAEENDSDASCR
jgi:hypothetical protein